MTKKPQQQQQQRVRKPKEKEVHVAEAAAPRAPKQEESNGEEKTVEVVVEGLTVDPDQKTPILLLREKDGGRLLPIWIGVLEATSIATVTEQLSVERPLTHDVVCEILRKLQAQIVSAEITELKESTFYARLKLVKGEENWLLECRPSDAVALAVRTHAPIFVSEQVLEKLQGQRGATVLDAKERTDHELADLLRSLSNEAFGKYKM